MDFFFTMICPTLGAIISNIQLASPFTAVLECRKRQNLGPLNPVPLAISFVNLIGVIIFGTAMNDKFIVLGCAVGIILNFLGCTTAMSLLAIQSRFPEVRRMERLILTGVSWYILLAVLSVTGVISDVDTMVMVLGASTTVTTILYYCAPLSTLRLIVTLRDASSLYLPMLVMNLISSSLWFSYGLFGVFNVWIYVPNCMGLLVTVAQLLVKFFYSRTPRRPRTASKQETELIGEGQMRSDDESHQAGAGASGGLPEEHARQTINALMGMGLGGLGGIGGVGAPGLVSVDLSKASDLQPLADATEHVGLGIGEALLDAVPTAASAICAAVEDVGQILFSDTPEAISYLKLSQENQHPPIE